MNTNRENNEMDMIAEMREMICLGWEKDEAEQKYDEFIERLNGSVNLTEGFSKEEILALWDRANEIQNEEDEEKEYQYIVDLSFYKSGSGYSHTETIDKGVCEKVFDAESWAKDADLDMDEDEWVDVEVRIYDKDADPMFDGPISKSSTEIK